MKNLFAKANMSSLLKLFSKNLQIDFTFVFILLFLHILAELGFDLRDLCLLGRHSVTRVMPSTLFALIIFLNRVLLVHGQSGSRSSYLHFLCGWDDRHEPPCSVFFSLVEMGWCLFFLSWLASDHNLQVFASLVARIMGVCHHA
jgi:hypothetical protein